MSESITITGNIASDPERRLTGAGDPITSFRLASTQRRLDNESGKWVDGHTNWYTVSAFRRLAVHTLASLHIGQRVIVTGRLKIRTWETASSKGTSVDIDADAIGHDLLWGTSEFRKDATRTDTAGEQAPVTEWTVESAQASPEDWTPSLATSEPAQTPQNAEVTGAERQPAFAGAEAPF